MKIKQKTFKNIRLSWSEIKKDGTIADRTYTCDDKSAQWHLDQMRKSPSLRNIKMEKL